MARKILLLVGFALLIQLPCIAAKQAPVASNPGTEEVIKCYDEESVAEAADQLLPGYQLGQVDLDNLDQSHYPFAHFVISYRPIEGVAHLLSQDKIHAPKHEPQNIGRLPDWLERVGLYREGLGWSNLTLEDARKIFGEPKLRGKDQTSFYTFDAFVTVQREKQLFHLDLRFDNSGAIKSYRVRGIGVRNPQWVSD